MGQYQGWIPVTTNGSGYVSNATMMPISGNYDGSTFYPDRAMEAIMIQSSTLANAINTLPPGMLNTSNMSSGSISMLPSEPKSLEEEAGDMTKMLIDALQDTGRQIGEFRSSVDAMRVQVNDLRNELTSIKKEIESAKKVTGVLGETTHAITEESVKTITAFNEVHDLTVQMHNLITMFNSVASDPMITSTIDDIRSVSGRFDTIIEE